MTVLHVSPLGSDQNSGADDAPLKTLTKANAVAAAGDEIRVRPGTYHEILAITTPNTRWIGEPAATIDGYYSRQYLKDGVGPRMTVSPLNGGGSRDFLPRISSLDAYNSLVEIKAAGVIFDGFAVVNSAQIGLTVLAANVVVRNCKVDFCRAQGVRIIPPSYQTGIVLEGCDVSHTVIRRRDGFGPIGGAAVMVTTADGATIRNNRIGPSCGDGVVINDTARNTVVRDNVVFCELMDEGSSGCVFERNLVCGLPANAYFDTGFLGLLMSFEREGSKPFRPITTRVVNNVFVNCGTLWVIRNGDKTDTQMSGAYVAHNTFVAGPGTNQMVSAPPNAAGRKHRNSIIENNVFVTGGKPSNIGSNMLSQCTLRHNAWSDLPVAALRGVNDIVTGVGGGTVNHAAAIVCTGTGYGITSVAISPDNYAPGAGSPLIDAGFPGSSVTADIYGRARGTAKDIGAFEFKAVTQPEPEPSPGPEPEQYFLINRYVNGWALVVAQNRLMIHKDEDDSLWDLSLTQVQ